MYYFNPTIFVYEDTLYSLVRKETDVIYWENSILSYELNIIDYDNVDKKLKTYDCSFEIESNKFNKILRKETRHHYYCIEDIKYSFTKNKKIYGICNLLI